MSVQVSVLIPTRDRPKKVRRCINSVLAQEGVTAEVVVFDDASIRTGREQSLTEPFGSRVRVLRVDAPVGAAKARNVLADAANGRLLVYLDDDAYLDQPGLLRRVVRAFEEHADMGIAAFRVVDHTEKGTRLRLPISRWQQWKREEEIERERPVSVFVACGYAIRAEVMTTTGGYEEFFWYMGEEQDLSFKALEEGYTIWYVPDVRVEHVPGGECVRRPDEQSRLFYNVRNRAYLARHHLPRQYLPSYLTFWLFVMVGQAVLTGDGKGFLEGLQAAWSQWTKWSHNPLSDSTLHYLRRHGGRLWF